MAKKQIRIRIYPDGHIEAETLGIKGKDCTAYAAVLQELLKAKVTATEYTPEYYETAESVVVNPQQQTDQLGNK